ncbi:MAG: hypothetical protein GX348_00025 [Veillonellaceae bacterium]|mgnify:CR=1 FL=1|jgi:hypothetical protein|nr:hypothetical protein [Veillonellaceae bacterium]
MSYDNLYYFWQKAAFFISHTINIWQLMVLLGTAVVCWFLAAEFNKKNARAREAKLSRLTAAAYTSIALVLWLFSFIFK